MTFQQNILTQPNCWNRKILSLKAFKRWPFSDSQIWHFYWHFLKIILILRFVLKRKSLYMNSLESFRLLYSYMRFFQDAFLDLYDFIFLLFFHILKTWSMNAFFLWYKIERFYDLSKSLLLWSFNWWLRFFET